MADLEHSAARSIIRTLRERGHKAYLVGGCVRDIVLGREPADYDVSTDATPEQVMRIFPRTWAVGAQFGVVLVPIDPSGDLDIWTSGDRKQVELGGEEAPPATVDKIANRAHAIE